MASRLFVIRLNSVDLPTFGRPTSAMTGFTRRGSWMRRSFRTEGVDAALVRRHRERVAHPHRVADDLRTVGRQPQLRRAGGAIQEVHPALVVAEDDDLADGQDAAQVAVLELVAEPDRFAVAAAARAQAVAAVGREDVVVVPTEGLASAGVDRPQGRRTLGVDA